MTCKFVCTLVKCVSYLRGAPICALQDKQNFKKKQLVFVYVAHVVSTYTAWTLLCAPFDTIEQSELVMVYILPKGECEILQ